MFIDARHIQMCMNSLFRFDATHAWKAHLSKIRTDKDWMRLLFELKEGAFFRSILDSLSDAKEIIMGIKGCGQNGMYSGMVLTISEWLCKVDIN